MSKTIHVPLPVNLEDSAKSVFEPYTSYIFNPLKVKRLSNVFVTFSGLAINRNGLLQASYHDYPEQHIICSNEASLYYEQAEKVPENLIELDKEKTYLLIHHPWFNYYHWLIECILRLWMVRDNLNSMILILPDYYQNSDFIMGSLEPFKVPEIFYVPARKSLFVERLCMPQIKPICDSYDVPKLKAIRAFYLNYVLNQKKIDIDKGDKIYLSRKKAARKKVVNEVAVEKLMIKYGFHILDNEDYTFLEQIGIYSNAGYLVSIHGSGLTNMIFMKEGSNILEIHKKKTNTLNRPSFVFWYQAAALNFTYYHQVCDPITEDDDYFFGDFDIDLVLLEKNLAAMLS